MDFAVLQKIQMPHKNSPNIRHIQLLVVIAGLPLIQMIWKKNRQLLTHSYTLQYYQSTAYCEKTVYFL